MKNWDLKKVEKHTDAVDLFERPSTITNVKNAASNAKPIRNVARDSRVRCAHGREGAGENIHAELLLLPSES